MSGPLHRSRLEEARPLALDPEGVAAEVERLAAEYGRELPATLAAMAAALELATSDGGPSITRAAVTAARDVAHRLKGTAGSFGFGALGEHMGALEQLLRGYLDAGTPLDARQLQAMLEDAGRLATPPEEPRR